MAMISPQSFPAVGDSSLRWPEGALVYHIYPRSFQDSNGDGIGDLPGITKRLAYIRELGANAIWLSPFYSSPMADFGYDVADYCAVDPQFGSLNDFKELLSEAKRHNLKVMVDLVPNHTSDEHAWFEESRQSKAGPRSDWYIWRDAAARDGSGSPLPPNNWRDALSGGSAWEWSPEREQFYLHSFNVKQPDLNWANPEVREAIKDAMRFWLSLGVDGFRVDAVYWMAKHPLFSDDSPNPEYVEGEDLRYDALLHDNSRGWPAVYAYLSEIAEVLKEPAYQDSLRFMVTEAYPDRHNPLPAYMNFYASVDPKVAAPFNFEGLSMPWAAAEWRKFLRSFHSALGQFSNECIPSYAFGNHDQPRLSSRLGEAPARSASVLLMTLPGMIFLYYGDELGMKDVTIPPDMVQDPAAKGDPKHNRGRDPQRTPMQWSAEANAGFSDATQTWLPVAADYKQYNVEVEQTNEYSLLSLYRTLGKLRNEADGLRHGAFNLLDIDSDQILGYTRTSTGDGYVVLINFSDRPATFEPGVQVGTRLVSSDPQSVPTAASSASGLSGTITLGAYEAVVCVLA
jgi:alpha-glucosidase